MIKRWIQRGGAWLRPVSPVSETAWAASADRGEEDVISRRRARALARRLDECSQRGARAAAERLIQIITRRGVNDPVVIASMARHRLSEGQPEAALRILESCSHCDADTRLLRAVVLTGLGRAVEAHGDLHKWRRNGGMPAEAQVLLTNLVWTSAGVSAAREQDDLSFEGLSHGAMNLLSQVATGSTSSEIHDAASALHAGCRMTRLQLTIETVLRGLGLGVVEAVLQPTELQVTQLSRELAMCPDALHLLVEAQEIRRSPFVVRLLMAAIPAVIPHLESDERLLKTIVRLTRLSDQLEAGSWSIRMIDVKPKRATTRRAAAGLRDIIAGTEKVPERSHGVLRFPA